MKDVKIYNSKGKEAGTINLPENVFGVAWNADFAHQVITSLLSSARENIAHTKTRGEVSGGGKKPWKQKGTGRARHGSTRSPIWVGGGVTHGPRNDKNYDRKVNKKAKDKALAMILSAKLRDGEILFVDSFGFSEPKTQGAVDVLKNFSAIAGFEKILTKKTNSAYIATLNKDKNIEKSFSNMANIDVKEIRNMSPIDLLSKKFIVIESPEESIKVLEARVNAK